MTDKIKIPFYYINLDSEKEKRLSMERQLKEHVNEYYRINAIQGIDGRFIKNRELEIEDFYYKLNYSEEYSMEFYPKGVGCLLSHIKTFNTIGNKNIACVCEDDLSFELIKNPNKFFFNVIKEAPGDWEVIKLHSSSNIVLEYCFSHEELYIPNEEIEENTMKYSNSSTLIYLINFCGIKKFKKKFYNDKFIYLDRENISIDSLLCNELKTYQYKIPLFKTKEEFEKNQAGIDSNEIILRYFEENLKDLNL